MAISPPSDIVLDVTRAVEPQTMEAARAQLARRASGVAGAAPVGAFSLTESLPTGGIGLSRSATAPSDESTYKKFESMVLQTFIQNMLPKDTEGVYGKGLSGDMWKSMMADKLAGVMTERGGIGIADSLLAQHYKDGDKTVPVGPLSRGPERSDADEKEALSVALIQEIERKLIKPGTKDETGLFASKPI